MFLTIVMYAVAVLLTLLPTLVCWFSRNHVVARRKQMLEQDFNATNSNSDPAFKFFVDSRGGVEALKCQVQEYMTQGLWLPLLVLLALNTAGFATAESYVRGVHLFQFGASTFGPLVFTFFGAYVFNLGAI